MFRHRGLPYSIPANIQFKQYTLICLTFLSLRKLTEETFRYFKSYFIAMRPNERNTSAIH